MNRLKTAVTILALALATPAVPTYLYAAGAPVAVDATKEPLLAAAAAFFSQDDWNPSRVEGKTILKMGFKGNNGTWTCFAQTREEQKQFLFFSILPNNVPPERRAAVSEFITRANYGVYIGNFEMDMNDGEVRFRTSVDVEGGSLAPTMIKNLAYTNVMMMDKYLAGLNKVAYGGADAAATIKEIEG